MGAQEELIENLTYDELHVGQRAQMQRSLTMDDIQAFALVSGDVNPANVDIEYADASRCHDVIAQGMFAGALISSPLGTEFPWPGTLYLEQSLRLPRPVRLGVTLRVGVVVVDKDDVNRNVRLDCEVRNQRDERVVSGQALVRAPSLRVVRPRARHPTTGDARRER